MTDTLDRWLASLGAVSDERPPPLADEEVQALVASL